MKDIFIISDTHFGHENVLKFTDSKSGNLVRPEFTSIDEMNEVMVENWNKTVTPQDIIYHLGDVYFGQGWKHISRLNGHKRLILGNHDDGKDERLTRHFQKITMWRQFRDFDCILSHVPIHESCMERAQWNLHGHIHQNPSPGPRYINCCVEWQNYTPKHIEELIPNVA